MEIDVHAYTNDEQLNLASAAVRIVVAEYIALLAERASTPTALDALRGLIGLIDLIACRTDLPADLVSVLKGHHRYVDAVAVVRRLEGGR